MDNNWSVFPPPVNTYCFIIICFPSNFSLESIVWISKYLKIQMTHQMSSIFIHYCDYLKGSFQPSYKKTFHISREISQLLIGGLAQEFVQIHIIPSWWILMTLMPFFLLHQLVLVVKIFHLTPPSGQKCHLSCITHICKTYNIPSASAVFCVKGWLENASMLTH